MKGQTDVAAGEVESGKQDEARETKLARAMRLARKKGRSPDWQTKFEARTRPTSSKQE